MDFYDITTREWTRSRSKDYTITPTFNYGGKDIVCKGGSMYAFWYNDIWNTDRIYLMDVIDSKVAEKYRQIKELHPEKRIEASYMKYHDSNVMRSFMEFTRQMPESDVQFNSTIIFSDQKIKREDYATEQLSYTPAPGDTPAFDEMFKKLYDEDELRKIMWFIGAVLTNSMKKIEKFLFLYGGKGTGKGTILSVFKKLFEGYYAPIDLHRLTSGSEFATGGIKETPLLIDDDADLYSIKDDTNLLKLTSHDPIQVNNKYQSTYSITFEGLLVAASNQPYRVRNIDSGITRRAVVAKPTNEKHDYDTYQELMKKIDFELAHIAQKAIDIFNDMGPGAYEDYIDYDMMEETDHFYDFMRENALGLGEQTTLKQASELYKLYLEDIHYDTRGYKRKAKQGLIRYYKEFDSSKRVDGELLRNVFTGLNWNVIFPPGVHNPFRDVPDEAKLINEFGLREGESAFDNIAKTYSAQYTTQIGTPKQKWDDVVTSLVDIDTSELHYVMLPLDHIVIDLDITDENGEKDLELNLKKVKELGLPDTYMETSKSGQGVHLHYIYEGEPNRLKDLIEEDVEVKVFKGKSSLRRKLTLCNDKEIASIATGLPMKEEDRVYKDIEMISWDEKKMRTLVKGNLEKRYHANTKPSVDFIVKVFNDAEKAGTKYDLRDMRQDVLSFAASSTNQAPAAMKAVSGINFSTLEPEDSSDIQKKAGGRFYKDEELYFYDVEVFSNLFVLVYKQYGKPRSEAVALVNPSAAEVEAAMGVPLVGFNNRRYDNHILYAALLGEDNQSLFRQSQRIINDKDASSGMYSGAYELSYTDIYDYSNAGNKKSLAKWQVELGIKHDEFELPWDQPVPEDKWDRVVEYCTNDVVSTEEVFEATRADYNARRILSTLSGLSMNASTNQHTTAIVFDGKPKYQTQKDLVYTDLSKDFPGYQYSYGKSTYRGEEPGEGGYVYAEPGVYQNVSLFDVASMHPRSIVELNAFGPYTKNFEELMDGRLDTKHDDVESLRKRFDGKLSDILDEDDITLRDISNGLKTAINSVYGLTSARFDNAFRHPQNQDNIVAKRGALFMIDLKMALQEKGVQVVHIKTDSVKVVDATPEINEFIFEFGKRYGYEFELEDYYTRFALVNKAAYVCENEAGEWEAVGAQYKEPFVMKMLFTKEDLAIKDFFQTKQVRNASLYLGDRFIGSLAEVYASVTGEDMLRITEDKEGFVSGTKGFKWRLAQEWIDKDDVDMKYYTNMLKKAINNIAEVGDAEVMITDFDEFTDLLTDV